MCIFFVDAGVYPSGRQQQSFSVVLLISSIFHPFGSNNGTRAMLLSFFGNDGA
jgi:hypothetical protein